MIETEVLEHGIAFRGGAIDGNLLSAMNLIFYKGGDIALDPFGP